MDVRCEKCQTEYELDDARVTDAGVTVKCTTCGHLFRVKRKGFSHYRADGSPPDGLSVDVDPNSAPTVVAEGLWMIRSPSGDLQRFKELTTLQQWIVERKVTRDCEISRTGDTWKKLGDIA